MCSVVAFPLSVFSSIKQMAAPKMKIKWKEKGLNTAAGSCNIPYRMR